MLFESANYHDNLPFELSFLNIGEESKHCHKEIEIVLVLRGVTHYQIYHMDYELNPGDLIIADVEDLHQIHDSSDDILLLSMHVDTKRFENIYPNIRYMFFVCEECMEGPSGNKQILESKLSLLKHHIAQLALDCAMEEKNISKLTAGINELVSILVNHFQGFFMEDYQYKTSQENLNPIDMHRLSRITRYISLNYNKKITLDDVSNMEHLSSYYVSHLIKKTLGFNFQNFVNAIRLEFAEKLLVFSKASLMQISEECGFSSPNYFNKCFSAWHGKTPAQYRKDYHPCERTCKADFTKEEAIAFLMPYLMLSGISENLEHQALQQISISVDFKNSIFVDFWEKYAPEILLNSMDDILRLGYYQEKVKQIRPSAFLLEESLLKSNKELEKNTEMFLSHFDRPLLHVANVKKPDDLIIAGNGAVALQHILNRQDKNRTKVFLFGQGNALFTEEGLATPFYSVYEFFSQLNRPQISVGQNHVLVKTKDSFYVLLFNIDPLHVVSVKILTHEFSEKFYLLKTEILENENCYSAIDALGSPSVIPELLKKRINCANMTRPQFSAIDKNESPILEYMVQNNTVTILEIIGE